MSFHKLSLVIHFPLKSIREQEGVINMTRRQKSLTDHQLHETISATGRTCLSLCSVWLWESEADLDDAPSAGPIHLHKPRTSRPTKYSCTELQRKGNCASKAYFRCEKKGASLRTHFDNIAFLVMDTQRLLSSLRQLRFSSTQILFSLCQNH